MASTADAPTAKLHLLPYLAVFQHDLQTLWRGRLLRLWLLAAVAMTVLLTMGNWATLRDAPLVASLLFPFLVFPWFLVIIVLGVTPVAGSQAETLADGILSRPVARHGYLIATWAARVAAVLGVYLIVTVPAVLIVTLAKRPPADDCVTLHGVVTVLLVVALVLTLIVSLGFLAGTLLRKPLLAALVLIFAWYPVNILLSTFSLEELSPISLNQAATTQLRRPWREDAESAKARAAQADAETLANWASRLLGAPAANQPRTAEPDFFETENFDDFSLTRVALGYGVPTIAAIALAVFCFCRRDL